MQKQYLHHTQRSFVRKDIYSASIAYFFRTVTVVIVVIIVSLAPNKNNNGPKYLDQRSKFFSYFLI